MGEADHGGICGRSRRFGCSRRLVLAPQRAKRLAVHGLERSRARVGQRARRPVGERRQRLGAKPVGQVGVESDAVGVHGGAAWPVGQATVDAVQRLEALSGGAFADNREEIARYGLTVGAVQDVLEVGLGGMPLTTTVEGLERYAVNLRYSRDFRENLEGLREIIVPTPTGAQVPLGQLARIEVVHAPMGVKSEAAVPNAWIYVDVRGVDIGRYVQSAQNAVNDAIARGSIRLPSGYNVFWSGQYEYMLRAQKRLMIVVPLTLLIIILIIYLNTRSAIKTAIVLLAVPFSLVGAIWILYLLNYNLSVAVWVGLIALAGLDAETGVVMLLYLDLAYAQWREKGQMQNQADLRDAIYHGAVKRVRPKAMTAAVIIAGLLPILWSHGAGADVMKRIATPMIGGVITSAIMELAVYPAIYFLWRGRGLPKLKVATAAN